mmetsp:Transcript_21158/g.53897  ORF Transcript_21158/g.53897 Transcript_21158/m.53897 type:complete len:291 (+) Transcript_21158:456-1328(+)
MLFHYLEQPHLPLPSFANRFANWRAARHKLLGLLHWHWAVELRLALRTDIVESARLAATLPFLPPWWQRPLKSRTSLSLLGSQTLYLSTIRNPDLKEWLAKGGAKRLNFGHHIHTSQHLSQHLLLAVEPWSWLCQDGKHRAVGIWLAEIALCDNTGPVMRHSEGLVVETPAEDGLSVSRINEITACDATPWSNLHHGQVLVMHGLTKAIDSTLTGAQTTEVFDSIRHHVAVQLDLNASNPLGLHSFVLSNSELEKNDWSSSVDCIRTRRSQVTGPCACVPFDFVADSTGK